MGRKVRSILLLILLLVLIYCQQSNVIYAEDIREPGSRTAGEKDSLEEENAGGKEEAAGEETVGKGDVEKEDTEKGDTEVEEEEPPIQMREYELDIPEADGENGYYVTVPNVEIRHVNETGNTVYCLKCGERIVAEGRLSEEGSKALLGEGQFAEGHYVLTVYMEDETGVKAEGYEKRAEFTVDTQAPVFEMAVPSGFDSWYQGGVELYVQAEDGMPGSGIDTITCYCGGEYVDTVTGNEGTFLISQASRRAEGAEVTVMVSDKAGHRISDTRKVYIDDSIPQIKMEGMTDYMITSREVPVTFQISEENGLRNCEAVAEWEDTEGNKTMLPVTEWSDAEGVTKAEVLFKEDGIYRVNVSAEDLAGHLAVEEAQFIIDSHNPVIRYVDRLEGQCRKSFRWDYQKEEFIKDFTTYAYQIQLDSRLYPVGEEIEEEGRHLLRVEAVDAAGNKAEAKAGFMVDHTPPEILFLDVENSGIYEETKTFGISSENAEDKIQEVWINGVLQNISRDKEEYFFTVQENKGYEVAVKARDKAGNEASASIMFEVVPKETILQKAWKPVRKIFMRGDSKEKREEGGKKEKEEGRKSPLFPVTAAVCGTCAAGGAWMKKRRR